MKRLSIILPIYNVGPYIEKCIQSLVKQRMPLSEYEIICVNDGSPDDSREVVLELQKKYENIILIDQENQGVSMARNKGLEISSGKYLLFIDPDDFIHANILDTLLLEAVSKKAQIAIPGYSRLDSNGNTQVLKSFDDVAGFFFSGIQAYSITHGKGQKMSGSSVGILFEADFIKDNYLDYPADVVLNQDVAFLAKAHCLAEHCVFLSPQLYTQVIRPGSATRSNQFVSNRVRIGFLIAAKHLKEFQDERTLSEEQIIFLNGPIAKFVLLAVYASAKTFSGRIFRETKKTLREAGLNKLNLKSCSKYNRICGKSYNISPLLAIITIYIYQKFNIKYG